MGGRETSGGGGWVSWRMLSILGAVAIATAGVVKAFTSQGGQIETHEVRIKNAETGIEKNEKRIDGLSQLYEVVGRIDENVKEIKRRLP